MPESGRPDPIAIVVAAGRGARAQSDASASSGAKQYRMLAGRSVLARSVSALLKADERLWVLPVIHPDDGTLFDAVLTELREEERQRVHAPVHGGATRQDSVRHGLEALDSASADDPIVLIHDAARPFVSPGLVERLLAALSEADGAIPALPVTDTLKRADDAMMIDDDIARRTAYAVQTPQVFRLSALLNAHRAALRDNATGLTDDAAIATRAGFAVRLVPGDADNIKLTYAEDFGRAERALAESGNLETRIGQGFDVHRFGPGEAVILGGVSIPHDKALTGHSDADVGLHAITDALLGALAAGDIGSHFPPSDPQWKGADSAIFLAEAVRLVAEREGRIRFVDLTFACETPKIGPHRDAMRSRIAELLGIPVDRVSVKATTTEQLGFTGRGEGIAAYAAATIALPVTDPD